MKKIKVVGYIIRKKQEATELLVFEHLDHPSAGIQVPAGTVERWDTNLESALFREIYEESGISKDHLKIIQKLGSYDYFSPLKIEVHERHTYLLHTSITTNTWIHQVVSNGLDNHLRFKYYWLPLNKNRIELAGELGKMLDDITPPFLPTDVAY
ncbi:NUDIX domain-containing protein [Paenibacillus yanchengensis]|uniref:NUDIX domain-containing protein n=1 Tax=Paenibacillus yanchengensis TaxID=2035833 RepID=A0ABW4YFD6_9BACL